MNLRKLFYNELSHPHPKNKYIAFFNIKISINESSQSIFHIRNE